MYRRPGSREEDAWLSDAQLAHCAPAETEPFQSPVPTRMVSNGEYMPCPQTEQQKRVEARIDELGNAWTPWNPLLDQIPNVGDEFHLVKYIQRFFLESQVAVAVLSNANFAAVPLGPGVSRPPQNITESLANEILTGAQTAAVR